MEEFKNVQQHVVEHRRRLHEIAEVGSVLPETSLYITSALDAMGIPYTRNVHDSGIVALIAGKEKGPCLAFRADMDALPIQEETGLAFASRHSGCMHACGHDAHAAMLLGAAELLMRRRDSFRGTVKLLFQANEELCLGAKQMIEDGALENPKVDALVSLHIGKLDPELKLGQIGVYPGSVMASSDRFDIYVRGQGGHCSRPDQAIDPISAAAQIISTLQTVVSRDSNTMEPRVLSFCGIESTATYNVIPDTVRIRGAIRAVSMQTRDFMIERLKSVAVNTAAAMRARAEVDVVMTTPVLANDPTLAGEIAEAARSFLPEEMVKTVQSQPIMGSEDAAFYHERVPSVFCFLCSANPEKHTDIAHHNSRFDIDEDVLWEGSALFTASALHLLGGKHLIKSK